MGQQNTKTKPKNKIIINKLNTLRHNDTIVMLWEDIEYFVSDGLCVIYNNEKYCLVNRFREKKELLPKSEINRIQATKDIYVINNRGFVNYIPKKSVFELIEYGDSKITITLFSGAKLQNCYTREEVILDCKKEVIVCG